METCRMTLYSNYMQWECLPDIVLHIPESGEYYDFPVGESVTIRIVTDIYYKPVEIPTLVFMPQYNPTIITKQEFIQIDTQTWELTTNFLVEYNGNYRAQLKCVCEQGYAYVKTQLKNAEINHETGQYLPVETTFVITCANNYEFQIIPIIEYGDKYERYTDEFEKVDDCTYKLVDTLVPSWNYNIIGEAVKKSIILDKYGLITVYRPTKDELTAISKSRWVKVELQPAVTSSSGVVLIYNLQEEYIDTAKYVVSLLKLYCKLEPDSRDKLYFGPYDMHMECDIIGNDIITLDCGTVMIKGTHGNSIDYDETDIQAYLPFIGFISLSTADFMDKEIQLQYQVNVINGDALAVFRNNGDVIASFGCNISFEIPYQLGGNEFQHTAIQPNTNYLLNEPPFIYVKTHNATNPDEHLPYHDTKVYRKFGDLTGYTEAREIDLHILSSQITKPEIDEIIQLLETGVFL